MHHRLEINRAPAGADKRKAILRAALELAARDGLHNLPMAAIARRAGVAAGTLYLYFESKEALLHTLYLETLSDLIEAMHAGLEAQGAVPFAFRRIWFNRARWHLSNPAGSNFIRQCEAASVLSPETLAAKAEIEREANARFEAALASGTLQPWPRQVHFALLEGPILVLTHLRDKGEIEITDEVLEMTFQGVWAAVVR